jgi:2'-5' RNA ligase
MKLEEIKEERRNGTYVAINFTSATNNSLFEWTSNQQLGNVKLVKPEQYHCTILYSRKPLEKDHHINGKISASCKAKKFSIFPYDENNNCLVLELECDALDKLHKIFIKAGGTHDYDEFIPHVTLCSGIRKDYKISSLELPQFDIVTDWIKTEPLDLNWASK